MSLAKIKNFAVSLQRRDIDWTDKYLGATPFHTAYWARKRIADALAANAHIARGILLDVGCGSKPYEALFAPFVDKHYGSEYSPESGYRGNRADIAGAAGDIPLADECVDTILCTEVMEHVPDPERVVAEFARILKPGGIVITTAPFFFPTHDSYDFFRYTDTGIAVMMQRHGIGIEKVEPLSGTGLTVAMMFNFYFFDLGFLWTKWMYPIGFVLRPLLWLSIFLVNCLGWIMEKAIPSTQMAYNHLTIGKKK
jgi:SAM-dependent methyltransferase